MRLFQKSISSWNDFIKYLILKNKKQFSPVLKFPMYFLCPKACAKHFWIRVFRRFPLYAMILTSLHLRSWSSGMHGRFGVSIWRKRALKDFPRSRRRNRDFLILGQNSERKAKYFENELSSKFPSAYLKKLRKYFTPV